MIPVSNNTRSPTRVRYRHPRFRRQGNTITILSASWRQRLRSPASEDTARCKRTARQNAAKSTQDAYAPVICPRHRGRYTPSRNLRRALAGLTTRPRYPLPVKTRLIAKSSRAVPVQMKPAAILHRCHHRPDHHLHRPRRFRRRYLCSVAAQR